MITLKQLLCRHKETIIERFATGSKGEELRLPPQKQHHLCIECGRRWPLSAYKNWKPLSVQPREPEWVPSAAQIAQLQSEKIRSKTLILLDKPDMREYTQKGLI